MWQRFTQRARTAIFNAQDEAQRLGYNYVSSEHILLGLIRGEDSTGYRVLEKIGADVSLIRTEIEKQLPAEKTHADGYFTLTVGGKQVVDFANTESENLANNYIGTEHLLLGLISVKEGAVSKVLNQLGVTFENAKEAAIQIQSSEGRRPGSE